MDKVLQIVDDEFDSAKKRIWTRIKRYFKDGNQSSADQENMKLMFTNKISDIILTSEEIKGEGGACLEVALVNDPSEKKVDVGPEASARVEIVLLKGEPDADDEEFDQNIVPEKRGKKPLLDGDVAIRLERGVGVVQNVKLRNHVLEIGPREFKLGARVVDEFPVKEAKTESFTVKDYRNKYHKKHQNPSLSDEVSRLCNIAKSGEIYKRLHLKGIKTVEDFLIQLLINRDELKSIVGMAPTKWEATIKNARKCSSEKRMYCYMNVKQKKCVVFNVLGEATGLYVEFHYSPMSTLSEGHKADAEELLASAYKNWGDVKSFDDLDFLQQYLITCLSTNCPPENPINNTPVGGREAAEMIRESSSRHSYDSFHRENSTIDLVSGDIFSSFCTDEVDLEVVRNGPMFSPQTWYQDAHDHFSQQKGGCDEQLVNELSSDEQTGGAFEVVQTNDSPNRWRNLLSRLFSSKRRGPVVDVAPHHKKQKFGD